MSQLVTNDYLDEQIIGTQVGSASVAHGILNACSIGATSAPLALTRATTLAQLTAIECDFPGYARQTVTWNTPTRAQDGLMESVGTCGVFQPSGSTSPQNAYCIFGVLASGSLGFCGTLDDAPVPLNDQYNLLLITLAWHPLSGGTMTDIP